jgi:protein tyrosine/serine phosphatase
MNRHIDFEGVDNFRDFGGYRTASGRELKRGMLYRSANHARATEADLAALKAMGVAVVVDLRRTVEREREPSRRWAEFAAEVIENDMEGNEVDWAASLLDSDLSARWFREDGVAFYRNAVHAPRYVELFARYFQTLARADGPVLVHCAAGKDRTGVICALTHHVAGVSHEDMIADYLLTNEPNRVARRIRSLTRYIAEHTGRAPDEAAVQVAVSADVAYLQAAFDAMAATHGSVDGYLQDVLGVDAAMRERIHESILA